MDKYDRNYLLLIERQDGTILRVTPPFTVEFDIHRNSFSSASAGQIRVYNLSPDNRSQIRKDQWDKSDLRKISFYAGYGKNLSLAFTGNITQAWSVREGNNMVSQIESFDGGYAYLNAITNESFPKNTPQLSIIDSIIQSMPGVKPGAIGSYPGKISRGNSYNGSSTEILSQLTGGGFFIDNGKAHCLNDNECIETSIPTINSQSGLIGTPTIEELYVNLEMLFEPGVMIGQQVILETVTADQVARTGQVQLNGFHKVLSIKHRGVISEAVCGKAITSLGLLPGRFTPFPEQSA